MGAIRYQSILILHDIEQPMHGQCCARRGCTLQYKVHCGHIQEGRMSLAGTLGRLRGAVGNALVWGAGWFTAALAVVGTLRLVGVFPGLRWFDVLGLAVRVGVVGVFAGAAFAGAITVLYRGRRLSEISAVRFGMGGGLVSGLFIPPFLQLLNILSGTGPIPWGLLLDDVPLVTVLGGLAAAGSLKLAQAVTAGSDEPQLREGAQGMERLPPA
jgi:hypothetical protein